MIKIERAREKKRKKKREKIERKRWEKWTENLIDKENTCDNFLAK